VDYALFLAILLAMFVAKRIHMPEFKIFFIEADGKLDPTASRPWLTDIKGMQPECIKKAALVGLPITMFFYMDQNISSLLTQTPDMKLRKGSYYHSSFLCMGLFNMIGPMFGMPFVTGSLPHSPQFALALSETDPGTLVTKSVCENRVAPLLTYALMLSPMYFPEIMRAIPAAAISATLIFVGLEGMQTTQLYERLLLLPAEPALYPKEPVYTKVPILKMHLYTIIQMFGWAGCWVGSALLGLAFPLWVAFLVPLRSYFIPLLFTEDELKKLDGDSTHIDEPPSSDEDESRAPSKERVGAKRFSTMYNRP
jgi:hypothetical protein